MKFDWKEYKLGDIAEIVMGQSPPGDSSNVRGIGIPLLNGPTEFSAKHPMAIQFTTDPKRVSKIGDILFCVRGSTTGKMNWSDQQYAIGRGIAAIRHRNEKKAQYFIKGILDYYLPLILGGATGSTFPNVSGDELKNLQIKAPSLSEQTSIASILSSLDDKIDLLQRQNKTLEQLAETLFRQWLVAEDNNFEEKPLDKIAEFLNGLACQKYPVKSNEEGLPVIKIRELRTGITGTSDVATNNIPTKYLVEDGDMLFSWSGSLDVVIWSGGKGVLNQHLFKVSSTEFPQWFYYLWVKQYLPEFQAIAENKATTMGHIQRHHLSSAMVLVPAKNKLKEMDETIDPLFKKIKRNSQEIKILINVRENLLPKLMSGELRIEM